MPKVLITGSSGFIGKVLKEKLLQKKYEILEFNTIDGDISTASLNFEGIDHVFHLAGKSFVPESWKTPASFYQVNSMGTLNVLEFCRKNNASLTLISSYVYGIPASLPINETAPLNPGSPYAHSKVLAENLCKFYQENFNVKACIVRPFNIYGPGQNDQFLIPAIIEQLFDQNQEKIELMDLAPKRDYLYINDLVDAIIQLYEKEKFDVYNLGSGYSLSVKEIVESIIQAGGNKKEYIAKDTQRKNEIPDVVADITKIKNDINWTPKYSFSEGISEIIARKINPILNSF